MGIDFESFVDRPPSEIEKAKFWSRVSIPVRGKIYSKCWLWTGAIKKGSNPKNRGHNGGYGCLWVRGKWWQAHRYSHYIATGRIGDGLVVDHKCRNRACVNPAHLQSITQKENVRFAHSRKGKK